MLYEDDPEYGDGFVPDFPGPDDESRYACPNLRHNKLHLPWFEGFADGEFSVHHDTLARPSFFRSQGLPTGINSAARHVVGEESTACPYCRERFRNPNALKLHVEQSHRADFEWLYDEQPKTSLKERLYYLSEEAENEASEGEQRRIDERIKRETGAIRDKYMADLLSGKLDFTEFL